MILLCSTLKKLTLFYFVIQIVKLYKTEIRYFHNLGGEIAVIFAWSEVIQVTANNPYELSN